MVLFAYVFDSPGSDASLPTLVFLFTVALGVDYNIFLMARVREEARALGTRDGVLTGLERTGAVITSAGLILAGTFLVLTVLPLEQLFQLGLAVAIGVLVDTFVVRSVLVPAIALVLGERSWWPSRLRA
jgi:RND superfamily putative drug exporter